jgi:hypothetical protein
MTVSVESSQAKSGVFKSRAGRFFLVIVACIVMVIGMYSAWNLTRSTQDRIEADVAALKSAPNDLSRKKIMERLCVYPESDHPPIAPVIEVGALVLDKISAAKDTYQIDQFDFFLLAIKYLEQNSQTKESQVFLTQLAQYAPVAKPLDPAYLKMQEIQISATIARAKIGNRLTLKKLDEIK